MRALLEATTDLKLCAEAATPDEALASLRSARPDVVCLDLTLGGADGVALILNLTQAAPGIPILVLSARDEGILAEQCLQAGALGYAMKSEPSAAILEALRSVARGRVHVSARVAAHVLSALPRDNSHTGVSGLSDREMQVFQLLGAGWTSRQISEQLGIGMKTVETHREHIKNKLGIVHASALVSEATRWVNREIT